MPAVQPRFWFGGLRFFLCLGTLAHPSYGTGPGVPLVVLPFFFPHEYRMRDDRHWQPPVLRPSRIPAHIRNIKDREGMVGTPNIPDLAPLLDATNTQEWEKGHRLKPVLLSPHNWAAFCSPQCYGRPSVGWRARAKAGATSTPQLGVLALCGTTDAQVWDGRRGLRPAPLPPHNWMASVSCFIFAMIEIPKCGREGTG